MLVHQQAMAASELSIDVLLSQRALSTEPCTEACLLVVAA